MIMFNGLSEHDLGIVIEEPTVILGRAPIIVENYSIEGSSVPQYNTLGYKPLSVTFLVQIVDKLKIDLLLETFSNQVEIEYKGRLTYGYFFDSINIERMVTLHKASVTFERHPFWYLNEEFAPIFENKGNVYSLPLIRLVKGVQETCEVSVNGVRFEYNFNGDAYVDIDCEAKNAKFDMIPRNRQLKIGWEFPVFKVGQNECVVHSGDVTVLSKKRSRYL